MVGYDSITPKAPLVAATPPPGVPRRMLLRRLRQMTVDQGFTEVSNYSFVNEESIVRFGLDPEALARWADLLAMRTVNVGSPPTAPDFPRDPKDAPFLAAALAAHADFPITGDKDLLAARGIVATRIVTVAEFCTEFGIT